MPSKKRVNRICEAISSETGRNTTLLDAETTVGKLNRMLNGWANYFCLGPVSKAYRAVDSHTRRRLRQWLCAKHKVRGMGTGRFRMLTYTMCWDSSALSRGPAAFRGRTREPFSESRMR